MVHIATVIQNDEAPVVTSTGDIVIGILSNIMFQIKEDLTALVLLRLTWDEDVQ